LKGAKALKLRSSEQILDASATLQEDFIELQQPSSRKRKRDSDPPENGVDNVDYRSIEGKAKVSSMPADEDVEIGTESDVDDAEEARSLALRQKNAGLVRRTKEQPNDLQAWLDLLEFQAELNGIDGRDDTLTSSARRTLADLRLSIYEKALKQIHPGTFDCDRLQMGMLEEGAVVWESSKLDSKWKEALRDMPTSVLLWTRYMDFLQTNATSFTFSTCKDAYLNSCSALNSATATTAHGTEASKVYIFLRLTCLIRDAAYDELAVALWQIGLEYYYFRPDSLAFNKTDELEALEEWWESDVPRVGEESAKGWAHFYNHGSAGVGKRAAVPRLSTGEKGSLLVNDLRREAELTGRLHLPAPVDDDDDIEDPYRQVMFSDVLDVVEAMIGGLPRQLILDAFLCSSGMPPAHTKDDAESWRWYNDIFIRTQRLSASNGPVISKLQSQPWTASDLFFRSPFPDVKSLGEDTARFIDRTLAAIVDQDVRDEELAKYYLSFKLSILPDEAAKTSKRMLKARQSSVQLYNAYALVEAKLDKTDIAVEVWKAALSGGIGQAGDDSSGTVLLWHSWMLTALERGQEDEALGVLLAMTDGPSAASSVVPLKMLTVSATQRVKGLRYFSESVDNLLSSGEPALAVHSIDCLAWFNYLVEMYSLDAAMKVYQKYERRLGGSKIASSSALELLHQAKAKLMDWHISHRRSYKPANIRLELDRSLQLFPENTIFLNMLSDIRGHNMIDDRLRDMAASTAAFSNGKPGLISWHHKIVEEIQRYRNGSATQNSVHSLFTSALLGQDSAVQNSPLLWQAWFDFECSFLNSSKTNKITANPSHQQLQQAAQRTKKVFYDGMRYLPWHKVWIVAGLNTLCECNMIHEQEVARVVEVMEERELRIRIQSLSSV
jgi:hypothetical protein